MAIAETDVIVWFEPNTIATSTIDNLEGTAALDGAITGATYSSTGGVTNLPDILTFDGTDDKVEFSDSSVAFTDASNFTIAMWYKSTSANNDLVFSSNDTTVYSNGYIYFQSRDADSRGAMEVSGGSDPVSAGFGTTDITDGTWRLAIFTYAGSTKTLTYYLNGTQEGQDTGTETGDYNSLGLWAIGTYVNSETAFHDFDTCQFIIFNRVLDSTERADLYNSGNGKSWNDYFGAVSEASRPLYLFGGI